MKLITCILLLAVAVMAGDTVRVVVKEPQFLQAGYYPTDKYDTIKVWFMTTDTVSMNVKAVKGFAVRQRREWFGERNESTGAVQMEFVALLDEKKKPVKNYWTQLIMGR